MTPAAPAVLFRTPHRMWGLAVAGAVFAVAFVPVAGMLVALGIGLMRANGIAIASVAFGCAALLVVGGLLFVIAYRQRFSVTTAGIEVVSFLRTRRIPWAAIRVIGIGPPTLRAPRATEIVLWDGSVVRPGATSMNFALLRGETPLAHGADGRSPTAATLAAIDAHQRYLRGEFGGVAPAG
ncbi:PH domain-containing protein [Microbacterium sp. gxy059]|uniref:PH domain-containing protein n=1 Tax=Microbacterium sp. gxy059 TaxID=2957199 RepID=UPI003D957A1A